MIRPGDDQPIAPDKARQAQRATAKYLREAADEIDRLRAEVEQNSDLALALVLRVADLEAKVAELTPPTAGECRAHLEAGGVVEIHSASTGWITSTAPKASYFARFAPDTPMHGWRLAPAKPRTERVNWWEAVGRKLPDGDRIYRVDRRTSTAGDRVTAWADNAGVFHVSDGTVEVLVEDES